MAETPRFELQQALMPYLDLLRERLRGPQRADRRIAGGRGMNDDTVKPLISREEPPSREEGQKVGRITGSDRTVRSDT